MRLQAPFSVNLVYLVVDLHYACRPLYTSNVMKAYEQVSVLFFFYGVIRSFLEQNKNGK